MPNHLAKVKPLRPRKRPPAETVLARLGIDTKQETPALLRNAGSRKEATRLSFPKPSSGKSTGKPGRMNSYCNAVFITWYMIMMWYLSSRWLSVIISCYNVIFSCDQAALWMVQSVRPSVCLSHLFDYVPIIASSQNFQELLPITEVMSMQKLRVIGQRSRSQRS